MCEVYLYPKKASDVKLAIHVTLKYNESMNFIKPDEVMTLQDIHYGISKLNKENDTIYMTREHCKMIFGVDPETNKNYSK